MPRPPTPPPPPTAWHENARGGSIAKICPNCGRTFRTNVGAPTQAADHARQIRFCSDICRMQFNNRRAYARRTGKEPTP